MTEDVLHWIEKQKARVRYEALEALEAQATVTLTSKGIIFKCSPPDYEVLAFSEYDKRELKDV